MAISNTTQNILRSEYYDDYYTVANTTTGELRGEEFDFHRILFRPRYGVQSRELTQVQTLLQAQLQRLGTAQFRDGDRVYGAQIAVDVQATSGQVLPATTLTNFYDRDTNTPTNIFDTSANTTKATVVQYVSVDDGETSNNYLVFKYAGAGAFLPSGTVQLATDATKQATFSTGTNSEVFSAASTASIDEGVVFVSGFYVHVKPQTIVLDALSSTPSYRVGLEIAEDILDELDAVVGETLLDPANNGAVGAHRFRMRLTLAKRTLDTDADANFIELCRVVDGQIQYTRTSQRYVRSEELNDILARRTYDESGNYVVRPFVPVIDENPSDANTFYLSIGAGKAYVQGYEIETTQTVNTIIRKGRETANADNRTLALSVGSYVYANRVSAAAPNSYFANTTTIDIHCTNAASINVATSGTYAYSKIGTAKVRMIETHRVPSQLQIDTYANNSVYRLFFSDVQFASLSSNVVAAAVNNNVAFTLTVTIGNGRPEKDGAIEGATITLGGADSPVSGTFTVNNYVVGNATHAYVTLREFLPALPNANTTYSLKFQTRDVDAFALFGSANTAAPYASNLVFQADVAPDSKLDGTPAGYTYVEGVNDSSLLYQIPERFVKANTIGIATAEFSTWLQSASNTRTFSSASNGALSVVFAGNTFSVPVGTLSAASAQEYFTVFDLTTDNKGYGQVIQWADAANVNSSVRCLSNASVASVGGQYVLSFTYHHGSSTSNTRTFSALGKALVTGYPAREKVYYVGNTSAVYSNTTSALSKGQIEFHTLNATAGFAYSLKTPDVMNLRKVLYKSSNTAFANGDLSTATDVTEYFTLDSGQRDNSYEYGRAIVNNGAASVIKPTGRLLMIFDWFQHNGIGYATVDSYLTSNNIALGLSYDTIPDYMSPRFNRKINLREVLDFRPTRSNYNFQSSALVYAASDSTSNTQFVDTTSGASYLTPVSDDVWNGSYQFYLARIDKIALYPDGAFHVIEGQANQSPVPPSDDNQGLLFYQVTVPPYTLADANNVPIDVKLRTYDHKRYTMKDLSRMEDRVAHLEYYTSLSQLERNARDQSITDQDNLERYKNGILVDGFVGTGVANVIDPDFTASIDTYAHTLNPGFRSTNFQFAVDSANSNTFGVSVVGDMAIPTYSQSAFVTQPLATHAVSVNPFNIGSFYGKVRLSPAVDTWKSTTTRPAQVIDMGGPTQAWVDANLPSYTNWGEWNTTWSGTSVSGGSRQDWWVPENWTPNAHDWRSMRETTSSWQDIETTSTQQRSGTRFDYVSQTTTANFGNLVVDTSIVHHMRNRDIVFAADGLRPSATLYPFFDGVDVKNYVQRANKLRLVPTTTERAFFVGQTVYVKTPLSGTISTTTACSTITGTSTAFDAQLLPNQLVRIELSGTTFDRYISSSANNTSATLLSTAPATLAGATLSTLTPVTISDVASRVTGDTIEYTISVVRVVRDADNDAATPYPVRAGALANSSGSGSTLIVPSSARGSSFTLNVNTAIVASGVVRAYNDGTHIIRFESDMTTDTVSGNPRIYFVSGPGAGQFATINTASYNVSTKSATLVTAGLSNITVGSTIYSIGNMTSESFLANATVTASRAGTVSGAFHLQDGTFAAGTRLFRLTDSASDVVSDATTTAETNYTASGLNVTEQNFSVSTRSVGINRSGVTDSRTQVDRTHVENTTVEWVDPLAQTFLVDARQYPQGVMVSSLDLAFATKPTDDIPVIVELRPVVNGYPSSNQLVPCLSDSGQATVSMRQDRVNTTTAPNFSDANTYTRFAFAAPVHLQPGLEYAIVVRSDSDAYTVYTGELGGTVIGTDQKVAKQPYAGSFFKSQNASTWTESPFEDLMFRLNRATWSLSGGSNTGYLVLRAMQPVTNTMVDSLVFYPHEVQFSNTTATTYLMDIKPMNANGDLEGQVATRYTVYPHASYSLAQRSLLQGYESSNNEPVFYPVWASDPPANTIINGTTANTIDVIAAFTTHSTDVAPYIDLKKFSVLTLKHLLNNMGVSNTQISITDPGSNYSPNTQTGTVATTSACTIVTGTGTAFNDTLNVGEDVVIGGNLAVTVASIQSNTQFTATAALSATRAANTYAIYDHLDLTISNSDVGADATGYAVVDSSNTVVRVVITDSGSGYLTTPTITISGNAALAVVSESSSANGNALTRYITKPVTLADGFDARDIRVYLDAYRPSGVNIYVYYKVLSGDVDTSRFDDQPWRLMVQETPDSVISTIDNQYREFTFKTRYDKAFDQSTDTTDRFKVYAVKVIMASNDTTLLPRIKNFRAIALDQ